MTITWLFILLGIAIFGEIRAADWLLLIPFFLEDAYDHGSN